MRSITRPGPLHGLPTGHEIVSELPFFYFFAKTGASAKLRRCLPRASAKRASREAIARIGQCNSGSGFESGQCSRCQPRTFSVDGSACLFCQKGTASNAIERKTPCPPCVAGSYAPSEASATCSACAGCTFGSLLTDAYVPFQFPGMSLLLVRTAVRLLKTLSPLLVGCTLASCWLR